MDDVVVAELGNEAPVVFALNSLSLAVPAGNPGAVSSLTDLERSELYVSLCSAGVPCGDLSEEALTTSGVSAEVDSLEPNVKGVLAKLENGDADAGLVYSTDVISSDGVDEVPAGLSAGPFTEYAIVALNGPAHALGERFVEFVLSQRGRGILADYGFVVP